MNNFIQLEVLIAYNGDDNAMFACESLSGLRALVLQDPTVIEDRDSPYKFHSIYNDRRGPYIKTQLIPCFIEE
jgi:hypothetical protein